LNTQVNGGAIPAPRKIVTEIQRGGSADGFEGTKDPPNAAGCFVLTDPSRASYSALPLLRINRSKSNARRVPETGDSAEKMSDTGPLFIYYMIDA
jgi:hypothetical protein